jgi:hypothetical protein
MRWLGGAALGLSCVACGEGGDAAATPDPASDAGTPADDAPTEAPSNDAGTDSEPEPDAGDLPPRSGGPWTPGPGSSDACTNAPAGTILADANASALVVDATHVYYADRGPFFCAVKGNCANDGNSDIYRIPRCGGAPELLLEVDGKVTALLDGGSVVYVIGSRTTATGPVFRVDKASKQSEKLDSCIASTAASPTALYYADDCNGGIRALAPGSLAPTLVVPPSELLTQATLLATAPGHLYYAGGFDESLAVRRDLTSGASTEIHRTAIGVTELAATELAGIVVENEVTQVQPFGAVVGPGNVVSVTLANAVATLPIAERASVVVDSSGEYLYALGIRRAELGSMAGPPVMRSVVTGFPVVESLTTGPYVYDVEANRLYWSDRSSVLTKPVVLERALSVPQGSIAPPARVRTLDATEDDYFEEIAATPDGGFVALQTYLDGSDYGQRIAKYDSDWNRVLTIPVVYAFGLAVAANGDFFAAAGELTRYSGATGEPVWSVAGERAGAWGVSSAGRAAVMIGTTLHRYSPDGELEWERPLNPKFAPIERLAVAEDGAVYAAGDVESVSTEGTPLRLREGVLVRLDPAGAYDWQVLLHRVQVRFIAVDGSGRVILAADADGYFDVGRGTELVPVPGRSNALIVQYDARGAVQWVRAYEGPSVVGLALGPDGRIAVISDAIAETDFAELDAAAPRVQAISAVVLDAEGAHVRSGAWPDTFVGDWSSLSVAFSASGTLLLAGQTPEPWKIKLAEIPAGR